MADEGHNDREFVELLRGLASGQVSEKDFTTRFWSYMDKPFATEAAVEVFDYMIDDMNMAEHMGLIVDEHYRWFLRESVRLIEMRASAREVKQFFRQKWPGA